MQMFFLQIILISTYWDSDKLFQSSNKAAESVIPLWSVVRFVTARSWLLDVVFWSL